MLGDTALKFYKTVSNAAAVTAHPLADAAVAATATDAVRAAMTSAVSTTVHPTATRDGALLWLGTSTQNRRHRGVR